MILLKQYARDARAYALRAGAAIEESTEVLAIQKVIPTAG